MIRKLQNPLVPIRPDRLEEAREVAGLTVSELARRAKLRQQTVDAMRRASTVDGSRRCRQVNRDRLAAALGLPAHDGSAWLGGEVDLYVDSVRRTAGGTVVRFANTWVRGKDKQFALGPARPSGAQLARYRLERQCIEAWGRDYAQETGNPPPDAAHARARFQGLLQITYNLTDPRWWSGQFLQHAVPEVESDGNVPTELMRLLDTLDTRPAHRSEEAEQQITKAAVALLQAVLEPWFEGSAELNYENVTALGSRGWWQPFAPPSPPDEGIA